MPTVFDDWTSPPAHPELPPGEVHVWRVALDPPEAVVGRLRGVLSPAERARADRYLMERDRRHFAVGRGWLRVLLGRYTGEAPDRIEFRSNAYGKPALPPGPQPPLEFNLSHSRGLALYALTRDRPLGVDLEHCRPMDDAEALILRFFSARERDDFRTLPETEKQHAFFRAWTRKEAYMKAVGLGFSLPLDQFDVSLRPDEPPRLLRVEGEPGEPSRWSFRDLAPHPDFKASLAVEGTGWRLLGFDVDLRREFPD